ncbi:MAG: aminoacyl-tRNA deacylase [Myxococcales bacterium]
MVPRQVLTYLLRHRVHWERLAHPRAEGAQALAHALHVPGHRVAKSLVVDAGPERWLVVLPASAKLDEAAAAEALRADALQLVDERSLDALFPGCERGAAPPFGRLFGLPVAVDASLAREETVYVRGGAHDVALKLPFDEFARLERPLVATLARPADEEESALAMPG